MCVTIVDYNSNLHTGFHDWYTSSISTSFSSCLSFCARLVLSYYPPFAERIGEVFILLHVCCFCLFFLFGQRFLSNPRADSRQILHAGVAWVKTCLLPFWGSATPGGKKRGNEIRVVSFLNRTATIFVYLSVTKCGRICRAHTCTHSGVEP